MSDLSQNTPQDTGGKQKPSTFGILSLVLGVLGFFFPLLSSVPGLILGILGIKKDKKDILSIIGAAICTVAVIYAIYWLFHDFPQFIQETQKTVSLRF